MTGATVVRDPLWVRLLMWVGFPLTGAVIGMLLKAVAGWVSVMEWAPLRGLFKLIASLDRPWGLLAPVGVGALAGVVFAFLGWAESLTVTVSRESVGFMRGDKGHEVARGAVKTVFLDRKELVLLGPATEELVREKSDLDKAALERAFREQGYPWQPGGDPYAGRYRRWVHGDPALPASADAVLKARARALERDDRDDAAELRAELIKLGVVVRDERKRQWWRGMDEPE